MKKFISILFTVGLVFSALIGFLHFFAPYAFEWYSYIPDAPKEVIRSVDYINFFFSLMLTGFSLIILYLKKRIFAGSREIFLFYAFLTFTWLCRVIITIILPWPLKNLQPWLLVGFSTEFIFTLIPLVYLIKSKTIK